MGLIKNTGFNSFTSKKENFCPKCTNRGRIKVPKECDREKFDKEFDRLDAAGVMEHYLCYDKAIENCQFDYFYCPDCENGQKYKDEYPKYDGI